MAKQLIKPLEKEQTLRLIAYAEREVEAIGDDISVYPFANNMDRTGNLLDSLCWGVFFKGDLKKMGYYRPQEAIEDSHLHEWSRPMGMSVNGHFMAQQFLAQYHGFPDGWEVIFAILAPYWGYWEKGHVNVGNGQLQRWHVMTRHYDIVGRDLSPADVTFHIYVAK